MYAYRHMSRLLPFRKLFRKPATSPKDVKRKALGKAPVIAFISRRQRLLNELAALMSCPDCAADPAGWPPDVLRCAEESAREMLLSNPRLAKSRPELVEGYRRLRALNRKGA